MMEDTPFHRFMNTAVDQMEMVLDGPQDYHVRRAALFRCFQALILVAGEQAKAEIAYERSTD